MSQETSKRLKLTIAGRVQGVFFRKSAEKTAKKLGLVGFTRNLPEGLVEVVAEGSEDALKEIFTWSHRGSFFAHVTAVSSEWGGATGEFQKFSIMREGRYVPDKLFALKNLSREFVTPAILPRHVAIIPDGNRRWGKEKSLGSFSGHEKGLQNTFDLLDEAARLKISHLTLWGFSTENWSRGGGEIEFLMNLFRKYLGKLKERVIEREIQFRHFGRRDRLPKDIVRELEELEQNTLHFKKGSLGLALDYGGRDEILRAINKLKTIEGEIKEEHLNDALDTKGFPDPDLIIRTSGEERTSGLMPWQGTYAELYFARELFPDFGVPAFQRALTNFSDRKRNFGH